MMPGRIGGIVENPLHISWHDSNWIPLLNPSNVLDYFSEKSNPFYDRHCNNEVIRMQRQSMDALNNMTGIEYILLHVQEPILYVVRKQHRHSAQEATPMADYYIIAGTVYQAPHLEAVFSSRILSTVQHLQTSFEEASSYSRYHPNKGYYWDFSTNKAMAEKTKTAIKKEAEKVKEEPSSIFQRQRVDMLLGDLLRKFPPPILAAAQAANATSAGQGNGGSSGGGSGGGGETATQVKQEPQQQIKQEVVEAGGEAKGAEKTSDMKPPPEKRMKM